MSQCIGGAGPVESTLHEAPASLPSGTLWLGPQLPQLKNESQLHPPLHRVGVMADKVKLKNIQSVTVLEPRLCKHNGDLSSLTHGE